MAREPQSAFSESVMNEIRRTYDYRCVTCLTWTETSQCVSLIDDLQLHEAVRLGVLNEGFEGNSSTNGVVQCQNCHVLFTEHRIVLSLPIPVLEYLENYIRSDSEDPLHEVFDLLVDAWNGEPVDLPDPDTIIPYIGLFSLVTLDPTTSAKFTMITPYLPSLSIIRSNDKRFRKAPANTSATATNVARILDALEIKKNTPLKVGSIPLAPGIAAFEEKRYWRIPIPAGVVFAALMVGLQYDLSECEDIRLAKSIVQYLCHREVVMQRAVESRTWHQ
ncbi:hypothetical protein M413DRAFT_29839 [Hebeloma cylindrosporum]|uniref:Uncharacterized protein n=1 Tax=Hebeloma cylindrosporum TaxID=76867 RepID=A0A0C2YD06_HEBCY|nr:hypothetical protein M413DRAFT_29839 [Hebeloma cylindrosporum h7]